MISRAVRFAEFGKPEAVLALDDLSLADLEEGEVLVRMLATPVNPADLNYVQGNYGVRPELPEVPGIEGCGEVLESRAEGFEVGDRVIFLERVGTWQSHVVCDAGKVMKIDGGIDVLQAGMLKVNPLTAWRILTGYVGLEKGDWVIQNAANSGVGRCLIQIAREMGLRTINVVRRRGLEEELSGLGGDHVLLDDGDLVEKVRGICGESLPRLASNAVGGDSALRLMDALADHGVHVTFGAMSMRSLKVPNKFLIFKGLRLEGLWITKWLEKESRGDVEAIYAKLGEWVRDGKLVQPVDGVYEPENVVEAVLRSQESKRDGKVMIDWRG